MKGILLRIRYLYLGLKAIYEYNIGDKVIYHHKKYQLSSYKKTDENGNDYWSMINLENGEYEINLIHSCQKIFNVYNIENAILGTYRFYIHYWHYILKKNIFYREIFKMTYKNYFDLIKNRGVKR